MSNSSKLFGDLYEQYLRSRELVKKAAPSSSHYDGGRNIVAIRSDLANITSKILHRERLSERYECYDECKHILSEFDKVIECCTPSEEDGARELAVKCYALRSAIVDMCNYVKQLPIF